MGSFWLTMKCDIKKEMRCRLGNVWQIEKYLAAQGLCGNQEMCRRVRYVWQIMKGTVDLEVCDGLRNAWQSNKLSNRLGSSPQNMNCVIDWKMFKM